MNRSSLVLLKTLLRSTSQLNIYRYGTDKKKKSRVIGNCIGMSVLYLMLMAYCILTCIGYGQIGITDVIPAICVMTISILSFFFTFFKTNGYLFNFKEYDMLMSLPFEAKTVAGCKFMYMYVKSLGWYMSIALSMMIGWGIYAKPSFLAYPVWLILSLFVPVIPMLIASFIGFLIAKISAGFRKTNMVQTILTFILVILIFASRFIIESIFRNGRVQETLESVNVYIDKYARIYLPIKWFENAVCRLKVADIILLIGVTVALFILIFIPVGRSYRTINSNLKNHAASKKYNMAGLKKRSVINAIAYKEFRRMIGSTVYMTNAAMGELLVIIMSIAALIVDIDKAIYTVLQGAPVTKEMLYPAVPFIIYFCVGMAATTAMTPSLEGKNYWIVKSLPITKKTLYQGKMLFNLYLTVPFTLFATICFCISMKTPFTTALLSLVLGLCLCALSTAWGCACGIKHMRLDWENEVEVVKQGPAVSLYLLPNMFATMALMVLVVFLGTRIDQNAVLGLMILIEAALAAFFYRKVMNLCILP